MKILGIDPGYAIVGYGVLSFDNNKFRHIQSGVLTTPPALPMEERLLRIFDGVSSLLEGHAPDAFAIEELFFHSNRTTAVNVCQARGVILLAASLAHVPVYEYTPLQVKQAVVGYGRAEKHQVMEMTRVVLGLPRIVKPDDASDALAIAICHGYAGFSKLNAYSTLEDSKKTGGK